MLKSTPIPLFKNFKYEKSWKVKNITLWSYNALVTSDTYKLNMIMFESVLPEELPLF